MFYVFYITEENKKYKIHQYNNIDIWYLNKNFYVHREIGAAKIWKNGRKEYWLNNKYYSDITSDEEWVKLVPIINILE